MSSIARRTRHHWRTPKSPQECNEAGDFVVPGPARMKLGQSTLEITIAASVGS